MLSFPPGTHNVYPLSHFLSLAEAADFIHLSKRSAFGFVHFFFAFNFIDIFVLIIIILLTITNEFYYAYFGFKFLFF